MPQLFMPYYAVDCPPEILQKYQNKSSPLKFVIVNDFVDISEVLTSIKFVLTCNVIAAALFIFVLFLNQKKYNKSYGVKIFCWNYIGIQFILCLISISDQLYKILWNTIWDSNILCLLSEYETPTRISRPPSVIFPRWYYAAINLQGYIKQAIYHHTLPLLLGFHRLNVYFGCSFPVAYKKYFKESILKYYYLCIELFGLLIFAVLLCREDIVNNNTNGYYIFDAIISFIQLLSCLFHVIITLLAICIILKYRNAHSNASLEVKSFLYFSIIPMTLSIISMIMNISYIILSILMDNSLESNNLIYILFDYQYNIKLINDQIITVLSPILSSILLLLCIQTYRKVLCRLIKQILQRLKINNNIVLQARNPNSVSSKISFTSHHVSVKHR